MLLVLERKRIFVCLLKKCLFFNLNNVAVVKRESIFLLISFLPEWNRRPLQIQSIVLHSPVFLNWSSSLPELLGSYWLVQYITDSAQLHFLSFFLSSVNFCPINHSVHCLRNLCLTVSINFNKPYLLFYLCTTYLKLSTVTGL